MQCTRSEEIRACLVLVCCIAASAAGGWLHCRKRHCRLPSLIEHRPKASTTRRRTTGFDPVFNSNVVSLCSLDATLRLV